MNQEVEYLKGRMRLLNFFVKNTPEKTPALSLLVKTTRWSIVNIKFDISETNELNVALKLSNLVCAAEGLLNRVIKKYNIKEL